MKSTSIPFLPLRMRLDVRHLFYEGVRYLARTLMCVIHLDEITVPVV